MALPEPRSPNPHAAHSHEHDWARDVILNARPMADRKPTSPIADARTALEQFQDYLAPQLDVYEQAVYLYMLRHSRLVGRPHVIVEPKSVRHKIACGLGKSRSPLAEKTCRDKLKSLKSKGLIELLGRRTGVPEADLPDCRRQDGA